MTDVKPLHHFRRVYTVRMIHRLLDWGASVSYLAKDAREARKWALQKMAHPDHWLIVSARLEKKN